MKKFYQKNVLTVIIFTILIAVPVIFIQWGGGEYAAAEQRLLAEKPVFVLEDGTRNPNAWSEIKMWFEDHIGFREALVRIRAEIQFYFFRSSPSEKIHVGKNGWYYYTPDENLQIASGEYTLTEEMLEQIRLNHMAIRDKLKNMGMEYVIVLPTSKVSIYPENMRYGDETIRQTPVDMVADYLESHSDLRVVRLKDVLLEAKKSQQVYFKTDTHWTQAGAYTAYQEIIRSMREWGLCETDPAQVLFEDAEYVGEFGAMMGLELPAEPTQNLVIQGQKAMKATQTERASMFYEIVQAEGIQTPYYYYQNADVTGPSVMIFGDSMFGSYNATELLAENFPELSYIWAPNLSEKMIKTMEPDVVVYELTERYNNLFPDRNLSFILSELEDYQAEIISYAWEDQSLSVTVKNSSQSSWGYGNSIRLSIFSEGNDAGLRAQLPMGRMIRPGEEVDFQFSLDEYPELFGNRIEVQMIQEGVRCFGEKKLVADPEEIASSDFDAEIVSHTAPAVATRADCYRIEITVKNTGAVVWSEAKQIRLCIWQDGTDWGYRIPLPEGTVVHPGERYTFELVDFVLPYQDQTVLGFQMLQEGVFYFGELEEAFISAIG